MKSYPLVEKPEPWVSGAPCSVDVKRVPGSHLVDAFPFGNHLTSLVKHGDYDSSFFNIDEFFFDCSEIYQQFPIELRLAVSRFVRFGNRFGLQIFRNFPMDSSLPKTPRNSRRSPDKATHMSELWLACVAAGIGQIYSFREQNDGELVHDICPVKESSKALTGESSEVALSFHTDGACHPLPPDFIVFFCLRGDENAATYVAPLRAILQGLSKEEHSALYEDRFIVRPDVEYKGVDQSIEMRLPILKRTAGEPVLRYDEDLFRGDSEEEQALLRRLNSVTRESSNFFVFEPGDLVILDNTRAIHGRSAFEPRFDGFDRWLQVAYVRKDLNVPCEGVTLRGRVMEVTRWQEINDQRR